MDFSEDDHGVWLSSSLIEWVMENLTKNAVDAMGGEGESAHLHLALKKGKCG